MAYPWLMRILQHWTQLLLFLTSTIINKKKTIGPAAPQYIPDLPSDVIIDILTRLPAECVLKCRQVCKSWLVLTSSRHFAEIHAKRAVPVLVLQMATEFESSERAAYSHDLHIFDDDAPTGSKLKVPRIGSLNIMRGGSAILCGSGNGFLVFRHSNYWTYFVLNLVTREHDTIKLPPPVSVTENGRLRLPRWMWCGILFHLGIGERILIFWLEAERGKFSYFIYMLSSKLLREVSTSSHRPKDIVDPIVFNDRLHWMSVSWSCTSSIISCDMNVEGFRPMSHPGKRCNPPRPRQTHTYMCLLEHGGKLAFGDYVDPRIAIWVLEDYDTWSWSLKYKVNLHSDVKCVPRRALLNDCIGEVKYWRIINGELIFYWHRVGIVGYHLERRTTRLFDGHSYNNMARPLRPDCNVVSYKKCLVSL